MNNQSITKCECGHEQEDHKKECRICFEPRCQCEEFSPSTGRNQLTGISQEKADQLKREGKVIVVPSTGMSWDGTTVMFQNILIDNISVQLSLQKGKWVLAISGKEEKIVSLECIEEWKDSLLSQQKEEMVKLLERMAQGPTLCGDCNLNGPLCIRCYANRAVNKVLSDAINSIEKHHD